MSSTTVEVEVDVNNSGGQTHEIEVELDDDAIREELLEDWGADDFATAVADTGLEDEVATILIEQHGASGGGFPEDRLVVIQKLEENFSPETLRFIFDCLEKNGSVVLPKKEQTLKEAVESSTSDEIVDAVVPVNTDRRRGILLRLIAFELGSVVEEEPLQAAVNDAFSDSQNAPAPQDSVTESVNQ